MKIKIKKIIAVIGLVSCFNSLYTPLNAQSHSPNKSVVIYGQIMPAKAGEKLEIDTITVTFWQTYNRNGGKFPEPQVIKTVTRIGGFFAALGQTIFNVSVPNVSDIGYLRVSTNNDVLLYDYLVEPGDSVKILFDQRFRRTVFAGPSAKKFQCFNDLEEANAIEKFENKPIVFTKKISDVLRTDSLIEAYKINSLKQFGNMFQITLIYSAEYVKKLRSDLDKKPTQLNGWDIIEHYKYHITNKAYSTLQSNIVGNHLSVKYSEFDRLYQSASKDNKKQLLDSLNQIYYDVIEPTPQLFTDSIIVSSSSYPYALLTKAYIGSRILNKPIYELLKNKYTGILRERLVLAYFSEKLGKIDNASELMADALKYFKTDVFRKSLTKLYNSTTVGARAYDFSLKDVSGKVVKLSDFKGKVVFIDFWFTGCLSCSAFYTKQLYKMEQYYKGNPNFVFLSISSDKDLNGWKKSINGGLYTSKHTLNLYTNGEGFTHPILNEYGVFTYPAQVLIDRKGKIEQRANLSVPFEQLIQIIDFSLAK
ncbi:TlpA disulfide reductase family protein [Chryseobacterium sp. ERMR1:04]|uniref:TlpA family protein disulfide reductase n=1 Tax=Chryseobacterium sp. ERMR1:04 TaxID=1705393 RepID=UPI0006C8BCF3|nr:TlpA disulfide reductase family protein [Chryseobacterium sp. ERMR1:04]